MHEVAVYTRCELKRCPHWTHAFATERKDHRYYELVEDTIHRDFDYRYFAIKDILGMVRAVQPFFILDLDLLVGVSPKIGTLINSVRRPIPPLYADTHSHGWMRSRRRTSRYGQQGLVAPHCAGTGVHARGKCPILANAAYRPQGIPGNIPAGARLFS